MRRYLLVALWPAGIAAIAAATIIAARRSPASPARGADDLASSGNGTGPAGTSGQADRDGAQSAEVTDAAGNGAAAQPDWAPDLIRLGAISCAGGALAYGVMALLGPTVMKYGPAIDEPIVRWTESHQVKPWAAIMLRAGKVGNTWTTWGAAGTAAACIGVSWRKQKWLPPAVLGAAILVDHYVTIAIRHRFGRLGPPGSPLGTYPSGGCDRVVLFYGLIAHLLWREFSGSYRAKVWASGAVAALAFNEAYSREYLSKHWFTDIVTGVFYGGVLLVPFIAAVRLIAGPAVNPGQPAPALASMAADRASYRAGVRPWVPASDRA
jgi:membrane-associated phospholipid phosphatase